jgi:hypothetical protein
MHRNILTLESSATSGFSNNFRTVFKTRHGRVVFLELKIKNDDCTIIECFYVDRNQEKKGAQRYAAKPVKLHTLQCQKTELLSVIEAELDKKFYGLELTCNKTARLSLDEYVRMKVNSANHKYRFLIMIGEGETYNGLPVRLRTRIKNTLHRSIYVELVYYKDGKGLVNKCYYYDRNYKRQNIQIMPTHLVSCFFQYSQEGILKLFNHEIYCDFTHMIVTSGIDLDSNETPLCGSV